jgi:threonine dehydrogenase-like Zn-dependent dehydrogenase
VGAIALHGVRRAEAQLGERVGVIGLGLVGQLAVRILAAGGCTVIGIDLDPNAVELAASGGARAFERDQDGLGSLVLHATDGLGLDSVLVCAAATSPDPVRLAGELARERGRVVIVGDVPIEADRALFYEKELELRLSRSYGPGRYDRDYEERGRDLPPAYVRWTEQRNMQAFLDLVASGAVDPAPLTTHRFPVEQAERAYALLTDDQSEERPFGILLEYAYEERPAAPGPHSVRPRAAGTARQNDFLVMKAILEWDLKE